MSGTLYLLPAPISEGSIHASLPADVIQATSVRYLEAYRLLTGSELGAPA